VIITNLPPILHRFHVTVKFSLARGECLTLTLSLGVIPANIAVSDISLKTRYFGLHFCRRRYRCHSMHISKQSRLARCSVKQCKSVLSL